MDLNTSSTTAFDQPRQLHVFHVCSIVVVVVELLVITVIIIMMVVFNGAEKDQVSESNSEGWDNKEKALNALCGF